MNTVKPHRLQNAAAFSWNGRSCDRGRLPGNASCKNSQRKSEHPARIPAERSDFSFSLLLQAEACHSAENSFATARTISLMTVCVVLMHKSKFSLPLQGRIDRRAEAPPDMDGE